MSRFIDMTDPEWNSFKHVYRERLRGIHIPLDISPGISKILLSQIDNFFAEVRLEVAEVGGYKESLESIIREWERDKADGRNEIERKQNATRALKSYPMGNVNVNMYELHRRVIERDSFLRGVLDVLYGKQSRLITITGVLKLEKDLTNN